MKFLPTLTFWTLVLAILMTQQADGNNTDSGQLKDKLKNPDPFNVLNSHQVKKQIIQRNWQYSPATPITIGPSHFTPKGKALVMTVTYSMYCREGRKECHHCWAKVIIKNAHHTKYVVKDFNCKV